MVNEAEDDSELSGIQKLGVRVIPLSVDEQSNFTKGDSITTNAVRTLKRTMRRNLQRYKQRREALWECLVQNGIISEQTALCEEGNRSTFRTYRNRAKAADSEITLEDFARVLFQINKKRGYKSSRKAKGTDEGNAIDSIDIARKLYDEGITPGQYALRILRSQKKYIPDFYRSDLVKELDRIWAYQRQYYPEILTDDLRKQIDGQKKLATQKVFSQKYHITAADNKGKDSQLQRYKWRSEALERKLEEEELVYAIADVNGDINGSSGYLGAISDRSKVLYMNRQTVGQYLMAQLDENPNYSLKNQTFYRQDYLDEFERIWETQATFHKDKLTLELKREVRDIIIFYQRRLKSKKAMLDVCTFENKTVTYTIDGKTVTRKVGLKVCPISSPLFQEYRIWQTMDNLVITSDDTTCHLELEEKEMLAKELTYKEKLGKKEILKLLRAPKGSDLNYKEVMGNTTMTTLASAYMKIVAMSGHEEYDIKKMRAEEIEQVLTQVFAAIGIRTDILTFRSDLEGHAFDRQPLYKLWHLLYSYEGDNSKTGTQSLIEKLCCDYGFAPEYAAVLAAITFPDGYGNLSAKAMRKILPSMKGGNGYCQACHLAGYRHSERSLTREELDNKVYKDKLEELPRNSLRNPVVEKILNQMINVVNAVSLAYGRPDEIRIEMARELKQSAQERKKATDDISTATRRNEEIRQRLQTEFGIPNPSRNDILRCRLYDELKANGYKTLYSNTYIPKEELFSKNFDIEHIIPQARLFDDSFSNKTLEVRSVNLNKSNDTAYDFIVREYGDNGADDYKARVNQYYKDGHISRAKRDKLLMRKDQIPEDFIDRDLRNTQYIARKACEILESMAVVVHTTGSITDRLRQDWQLVDVMQELNLSKYEALGLTETVQKKDGSTETRIKDWTKRNDHRHHAMDALTVAFTNRAIVQYLNNLNANSEKSAVIYAIEAKRLRSGGQFIPPMEHFRTEAKRHLQDVLVSVKAKNKVVTHNVNRTKKKGGMNRKVQLTPRGELHKETVYGHTLLPSPVVVKVDGKMTAERIAKVAKKQYREALAARLAEYNGDAKKAFTGRNKLEKNPVWLDAGHTSQLPEKVMIMEYEDCYPIRKAVDKDLKIDKVLDKGIREILKQRLAEYGGDAAKAFSNLDANPIWQNKECGIAIKRVRITGISTAIALRTNQQGRPVDYVSTGNNHHVAIFRDAEGELHEHIVSFFEATARAVQGLPVVDRNYNADLGWQFLYTMKRNEYFVFPNAKTGFSPADYDLLNPDNAAVISPNLFRVQKLATMNYTFRHHLETNVEEEKVLRDTTWKRIQSFQNLEGMVKVRIDHLGRIVAVGEY